MENPPYIAVAIITPFLTFCFFWLLETIKTANQGKQSNAHALRSILIELKGLNLQLSQEQQVYISLWELGYPMVLKSPQWERYCGQIYVPLEQQEALEAVYNSIILLNNTAETIKNFKMNPAEFKASKAGKAGKAHKVSIVSSLKSTYKLSLLAEELLRVTINDLEKESLHISVLKELFGPTHRIIKIFKGCTKNPDAK